MNEPRSDYQNPGGTPPLPGGNGDYRQAGGAETTGSVAGLLRQLTQEVTALFTKEVALAKVETTTSLHAATAGVGAVATGGAVLLAGFIILLMAAVYGLSYVVASWLAALIVGGLVAIVGLVLLQAGRRKLRPGALAPRRTVQAVRADSAAVRGGHHEH